MRRLPRLLALVLLLLVAHPARALEVTKAKVTLNPIKPDVVRVSGRLGDIVLESIESFAVVVDGVAYDVPIERLIRKKLTHRFKALRGETGVKKLVLDGKKRTFQLEMVSVALGLPVGPLTVELVTNTATDCGLVPLLEKLPKKPPKKPKPRKFLLTLRDGQRNDGCRISTPIFDPHPRLVGDPGSVTTTVAVTGAVEGGVTLSTADAAGFPTGDILCVLTDDGQGGDAVAADGNYGCTLALDTAVPSSDRVVASAVVGGAVVRSTPATLTVLAPLSDTDAQTIVDVQARALAIWEDKKAALGDGLAAKLATVAALRLEPGVASVRLVEGSITILYASGVIGGLDLTPRFSLPAASSAALRTALLDVVQPRAAEPPPDEAVVITNHKVLIWDPGFFDDTPEGSERAFLQQTYTNATCPRFTVTVLHKGAASVAALKTLPDYGTVALISHGGVHQADTSFNTMEAAEPVTKEAVAADAEALQRKELAVGKTFLVTPDSVRSIPGTFEHTLFWGGYCYSGIDVNSAGPYSTPSKKPFDALATAYTAKGVGAYLGFTREASSTYAIHVANRLFPQVAREGRSLRTVFDEIQPKFDGPQATYKATGYPGPYTPEQWVQLGTEKAKFVAQLRHLPVDGKPHVYLKPKLEPKNPALDQGAQNEFKVTVEGSESCTLRYRWRNTGKAGHFDGGDDTTNASASRIYHANATGKNTDTITVDVIDNAAVPPKTLYTLTTKVSVACRKCGGSGTPIVDGGARGGLCIIAEACCSDGEDNDGDDDVDCDDGDCADDPSCDTGAPTVVHYNTVFGEHPITVFGNYDPDYPAPFLSGAGRNVLEASNLSYDAYGLHIEIDRAPVWGQPFVITTSANAADPNWRHHPNSGYPTARLSVVPTSSWSQLLGQTPGRFTLMSTNPLYSYVEPSIPFIEQFLCSAELGSCTFTPTATALGTKRGWAVFKLNFFVDCINPGGCTGSNKEINLALIVVFDGAAP